MLDDGAIGNFKRIVGSFPEASPFAYYTVGLFAFCSKLWLARVWSRITGPIALLSLLALTFSTSSSGYAGLLAFVAALFLVSLGQSAIPPVTKPTFSFSMISPVLLVAFIPRLRVHRP